MVRCVHPSSESYWSEEKQDLASSKLENGIYGDGGGDVRCQKLVRKGDDGIFSHSRVRGGERRCVSTDEPQRRRSPRSNSPITSTFFSEYVSRCTLSSGAV